MPRQQARVAIRPLRAIETNQTCFPIYGSEGNAALLSISSRSPRVRAAPDPSVFPFFSLLSGCIMAEKLFCSSCLRFREGDGRYEQNVSDSFAAPIFPWHSSLSSKNAHSVPTTGAASRYSPTPQTTADRRFVDHTPRRRNQNSQASH